MSLVPFPRGDYAKTGLKTCPICAIEKPLDEYHRPPSWNGRPQSYCKPCALAKNKAWREANRKPPDVRRMSLAYSYRLTTAEWEAMYLQQNGCCAACGVMPHRSKLQVDHDHATGVVRGLLCGNCNRTLGHALDSVRRLKLVTAFLERHQESTESSVVSNEAGSARFAALSTAATAETGV